MTDDDEPDSLMRALAAAPHVRPPDRRIANDVGTVIGNYRIVQLLGTGGMGVVYLAEHVELGRKAVIKLVQERLSNDREYAARFVTEAKAAASIRHPGVVDVFDYGTDDQGRGYIVMEFLEGESLRSRLRRERRLAPELALAIAVQIANAVEAAHSAGVIHRDLKPDNVFLVPDPESPHGVRAKVLDFGLAKQATASAPSVTHTGKFIGTPLYMSPEQCRSRPIDQRSDIYSLGCILMEMVCGRPPFVDESVGDLIIAHTTLPPPPASSLEPDVSPALECAISRALAKEPADRYPTMAELVAALSPGAPPSSAVTQTLPKTSRRRSALVGALAVAVLGAAATAVVTMRDRAAVAPPATRGSTIAVLGFEDRSEAGDSAWLATALGELVAGDLSASDQLYVVPAADVARMEADLGLDAVADWSRERLAEVRNALDIDYMIVGTYLVGDAEVRVDASVYDTRSGEVVARTSQHGDKTTLSSLGARVSSALAHELGVHLDPEAPAPSVLPSDPAAARLYSDALDKLRHLKPIEARDLLVRAAGAAPDDPLIESALAGVWRELGYDNKARAAAKRAYNARAKLPEENQLVIEAQYRETTGQLGDAIRAYRTLFERNEPHLDHGLALAALQTRAGDVKAAYATLDKLRELPPPIGNDPRIELADATAAEAADDIERMRSSAEKAASMARKRNASLLYARARFRQGWALFTLGKDDEADRAYSEARQRFVELGDRSGLARTLNNIALAYHRKHRDHDATETFATALELATRTGDTQAQAWVLNNWAYVLADAGDLPKALELDQKKLALGAERGVPASSLAAAHINISEILRWRGDLEGAREHCRTAEDLLRGLDARRFAAHGAYQCGAILHATNDLAGAKKRLDQAMIWASDVMTPAEAAEIRIEMARVALDDRRAADAETLARSASSDLRAAHESSQQVCAIAVLASSLLAQHRTPDAAKVIATTASLPSEGVSFACRIEAEIVSARVTVARDPATTAAVVRQLEDVRRRVATATFVQLEQQVRLAIGELKGRTGRDVLRVLARDARKTGFLLLAHEAEQAADSP